MRCRCSPIRTSPLLTCSEVVLERMLAGVATRRHARIAEPVGKALAETATSTGRSAVSRRFVKQTETALGNCPHAT